MLKAIIFDCDGVIADTEPLHFAAFRETLSAVGITLSETDYYGRYVGLADHKLLPDLFRDFGREDLSFDRIYRAKCDAYMQKIAGGIDLLPGVEDLVRRAGRRIPLAVCSGARRCEIESILVGHGLLDAFETIVSSEDISRSKPDPEGFLLAHARLAERRPDLSAADCLVLEDSIHGIHGARAAGMRVVGVTSQLGANDLRSADRVVSDLTQLEWDDS